MRSFEKLSSQDVGGNSGFSSIELVVTLALLSVIAGIAALNLSILDNPLQDGTAQTLAFLKKARAKAVSTTAGITISPQSATRLTGSVGTNCDDPAPVFDSDLVVDLPTGVTYSNTSWNICFSARGIANQNVQFGLTHGGSSRDIEVFLGGAMRVN